MPLAGCGLHERAAEAFEALGCDDELKAVWDFVLFFVTRASRKDVVERMIKVHPDAANLEPKLAPGTRLLLAQDNPARFLEILEELARQALQTEDSEALEKFACGVIESKLPALGIFVARSMLPLVKQKHASFLFERILEARDKLELSPDDPFGDIIDRRFAQSASDESKDAAELHKAQRALDAKAQEVRELKESLGRLEKGITRRQQRRLGPALLAQCPRPCLRRRMNTRSKNCAKRLMH